VQQTIKPKQLTKQSEESCLELPSTHKFLLSNWGHPASWQWPHYRDPINGDWYCDWTVYCNCHILRSV